MRPGRYLDPEVHERHLDVTRRRSLAGDSAAEIAVELRCTSRTVVRYRAELRRRGVVIDPPPVVRPLVHGLLSTYNHRGCRCDLCRAAATDYQRNLRHTGDVITHGASGYQRGCRCDVCRAWQSDHNRRRPSRARTRTATAA